MARRRPPCAAAVFDQDGGRTDYATTVTVTNVAPIAVLHGIPAQANEDATFTATATVTDPSAADLANLSYDWVILRNGVPLSSSSSAVFDVQLPDNGNLEIQLIVSDDDGGSATVTADLLVTNVAPTGRIAITNASSGGATLTYANVFEAASADLAAGLHYAFSCAGTSLAGVTYASASSSPTIGCTWADGLPNHTVRGRVIDKDGGASEYTTVVATLGNLAPSITVPGSFSANEGTVVSVTAQGLDPEGGALDYAWDLDGNGSFETPGKTVMLSAAAIDGPSEPAISVRVTDVGGLSSSISTMVIVRNSAPTGTLNTVSTMEGTVTAIAPTNPSDVPADAAVLHYAFACDGQPLDSAEYATASASASSTCTYVDGPSVHTIRVRIMDKDGGVLDLASTVSVANAAPTVMIGPLTGSLTEGGTAAFTVGVSDPSSVDAAAGLGTTWTLTRGAETIASGGGTGGTFSFPDNGSYLLSVTASDKDGGTTTTTASVVVASVAPTATPVVPTTAGEGSPIDLALTGALDPSPADTDAGLRYAFSCTGDPMAGVTYATASTDGSATCTAPSGGGVIPYTLLVIDKDGARTLYTRNVTVTSQPPTARFVVPSDAVNGASFALAFDQASDPGSGPGALFTYAFDCGSGYGAFGSAATTTCAATGGPVKTVRGKVRDAGGDSQEYTAGVVVHPNKVPNAGFEIDADSNGQADGWTWPAGDVLSPIAHSGARLAVPDVLRGQERDGLDQRRRPPAELLPVLGLDRRPGRREPHGHGAGPLVRLGRDVHRHHRDPGGDRPDRRLARGDEVDHGAGRHGDRPLRGHDRHQQQHRADRRRRLRARQPAAERQHGDRRQQRQPTRTRGSP